MTFRQTHRLADRLTDNQRPRNIDRQTGYIKVIILGRQI